MKEVFIFISIPGMRGFKRKWSEEEENVLRKTFRYYLNGVRRSVHKEDLSLVQGMCSELATRTFPQIRVKLNNMKLGKSK